ncbi:hypothetical protein ACX80Z_00040 [Arthrobacter sp. TMT4-20]
MDSKDFGKMLMYGWALDAPAQREFDLHARVLATRFSVLGSGVAKGARVDFRNYIDYLRVSEGLPASFARLEELRGTGLSPELYATAGMTVARRAGEYGQAADFLLVAYGAWPENISVFVSLVETLISADRVSQAADLLGRVNRPEAIQVPRSPEGLKLGEMAAVCGAWPDVERLMKSSVADRDTLAARVLAKRAELALLFEGQTEDVPTFVLNLPEDNRKVDLLMDLYHRFGVDPIWHGAIDGRAIEPSSLPDIAAHRGLRIGKGALGCALGHVSMWKAFLGSNQSHGLFLEDDGLPFTWRNIPYVIDDAGDFDVLFVNERMSAVKAGAVSTAVSTLWETLGSRPDTVHGWGADGYVLSKRGAERLLDAVLEDKVLGHIDGQIASYGIPHDAVPQSVAQTIGLSVRKTSRYTPTLDIKCLDFPLVASMDFGDSTIGRVGGH